MRKHFILLLATACCIWAVNAYAKINLDPPPEVPPDLNSRDFRELTAMRESLMEQFDATRQKIDAQAENCHSVEKGSPKATECATEAQEVKSAVKDYRAALERFKTRLADQTVPLLRQPGEIENQKGGRYIDCDSTRQFHDRASSSLSSQKDAIERTQTQIAHAKKAKLEHGKELKKVLLKGVYDTARDMLSTSKMLQEQIDGILKKGGLSDKQRNALSDATRLLKDVYGKVKRNIKEHEAGGKFLEEFKQANGFKESYLEVNKLLADSGVLDEAGETLAGGFGPMGLLLYDSLRLSLDAGVVFGEKEVLDENDLQQAQNTYDNLKYQLSQMQEKLDNAKSDLAKHCGSGQGVVLAP